MQNKLKDGLPPLTERIARLPVLRSMLEPDVIQADRTTIHPTYHCFDDAIDFLSLIVKAMPVEAIRDNYMVVHAICRAPCGSLYAHGWVEASGGVIFAGILNGVYEYFVANKDAYYSENNVQEMTHYTIREVAIENIKSCSYGPWKEEYKSLCLKPGESPRTFSAQAGRSSPKDVFLT